MRQARYEQSPVPHYLPYPRYPLAYTHWRIATRAENQIVGIIARSGLAGSVLHWARPARADDGPVPNGEWRAKRFRKGRFHPKCAVFLGLSIDRARVLCDNIDKKR